MWLRDVKDEFLFGAAKHRQIKMALDKIVFGGSSRDGPSSQARPARSGAAWFPGSKMGRYGFIANFVELSALHLSYYSGA